MFSALKNNFKAVILNTAKIWKDKRNFNFLKIINFYKTGLKGNIK